MKNGLRKGEMNIMENGQEMTAEEQMSQTSNFITNFLLSSQILTICDLTSVQNQIKLERIELRIKVQQ